MKKFITITLIITIFAGILIAEVLYQNNLRDQLVAEYETKIENLTKEYESKIEDLIEEHEIEIEDVNYKHQTQINGYTYLIERDDFEHLTTVAYNY